MRNERAAGYPPKTVHFAPFCFRAGTEKHGAAAVLRKPANPAADFVAIEGRIEPGAAGPWLAKAVIGFAQIDLRANPRGMGLRRTGRGRTASERR
jgi:hypothetical protein